jgi:hypothetical protein
VPLSSNSIIHFTKTSDSLKGILENNFKIKYCRESINLGDNERDYLIPMVSFCDIPLSEVKDHIQKYGSYGIGLTKEWAERQGLNPVLYIEKKSELAQSYDYIFEHYVMDSDDELEEIKESEKSIIDMLRYMKNYQNDLNRGGTTIKNYRFSDEREWRFVPKHSTDCDMVLHYNFFSNDDFKDAFEESKSKLEVLELEFEPNDIKYIIIENDAEISEFLDLLRRTKGKTYSYHDIERLMTRILTTEQIVGDI